MHFGMFVQKETPYIYILHVLSASYIYFIHILDYEWSWYENYHCGGNWENVAFVACVCIVICMHNYCFTSHIHT
jgi:hypothetical protein